MKNNRKNDMLKIQKSSSKIPDMMKFNLRIRQF